MTDFSKLKQNNPLSFKLFEQWVEQNYETTLNIWNGTIRNEDVVDFLDSCYIFINSNVHKAYSHPTISEYLNGVSSTISIGTHLNRKHGVGKAITKAFELLENKLKQN